MRQRWLTTPATDLIFLIPAVWLVPVFVWIYNWNPSIGLKLVALVTAFLSFGHLIAPLLLYIKNRDIRFHVRRQRPNSDKELALVFLLPLFVVGISAIVFFQSEPTSASFFLYIAILTAIYHLMNTYHFGMQYFGISRFFLPPSARSDLKLIQVGFLVSSFVVPLIVWTSAKIRINFLTFYLSPPDIPLSIVYLCTGLVIAIFFLLVFRAYKKNYLGLPLLLSYLSMSSICLLICFAPLFFTITVSSFNHWIQAIFLTSQQWSKRTAASAADAHDASRSSLTWIPPFIGLLSISALVYFGGHWAFGDQSSITLFGEIRGPSTMLTVSGFLLFGLIVGFAFTHFYLERFIYRGNPLLQRRDS